MEAVDALLEATPDTPSYIIGINENKIMRLPMMEAVAKVSSVFSVMRCLLHQPEVHGSSRLKKQLVP